MKKYLYLLAVFMGFFFIGVSNISAAKRINLITTTGGPKNTTDNSSIIRRITNPDEAEGGELIFELKFKNSKTTEVVFVIDDSTTITSAQSTLLTTTAANITTELLDNYYNIKFGVYTIHPYGTTVTAYENEIQALSAEKNPVLSALNIVNTNAGESGQDIVSTLSGIETKFSADCENKMVFLFLSGFDKTNTSAYLEALESLEDENIKLITVLLDFKSNSENGSAITNLFGSSSSPKVGKFYNLTTAELTSTVENNLIEDITDNFPSNKTNVVFNETFMKEIYENFSLTLIEEGSDGVVSEVNNDNLSFVWTIPSVSNNSNAYLIYKLNLADTVKNVEFETNYNINDSATISMGSDEYIYDFSAILTFTDQTASPKTGFINILIPFLALSGMSILTYTYVKKNERMAQI